MRGTLKMALMAGTALSCSVAQAQYVMTNAIPGSFTEIRTNPSATVLTPSNIDDGTAPFVCGVTNALISTAGTTLYACTNGNISNLATFTNFGNTALPAAGPGLLIANYWDDLYDNPANGSNIYSLVTTEGGVPVHIIEWSQVQL